jgi:flagellar hook assembly protein FlgD
MPFLSLLNCRGRAIPAMIFLSLLTICSAAAVLFYGPKTGLAWHAPSVTVTQPENGEAVSGTAPVSVDFSIERGHIHVLQLIIDGGVVSSVPIGQQSGTYVFNWDSTAVEDGPHMVVVRAYSAAPPSDHFSDSPPVNVSVSNGPPPDTEAPVITITEPAAGALTNALPVTVEAELSDNAAVDADTVLVKLGAQDMTSQCAVTPESVNCPLSPIDGAHTITINCKDTSNNPAVQKSVSFTIDTTPPSLDVTSHADGQIVSASPINLSGTVSDAVSGVASVEINGETATINENSFIYNGLVLDEGENPIIITTRDNAGNTAQVNLTITYTPPACFADADCADGSDYTTDICENPGTSAAMCRHDSILCLNNADCDDGNPLTLDLCENPVAPDATCSHTAIACNTNADCDDGFAQTVDTCERPGAADAVCVHEPVTVEPEPEPKPDDTTPPVISITAPANAQTFAQLPVLVEAALSDDTGVDVPSVAVKLNAQDVTGQCAVSADEITCALSPSNGSYTLTINCKDTSGNAAQQKSVAFTVSVPPEPEPEPAELTLIVTAPDDPLITNNPVLTITGTTTPGAALTVNSAAVTLSTDGFFSFPYTLTEVANTITVKACLEGDCLTETRNATLDTRPPEVTDAVAQGNLVFVSSQDNSGGTGLDHERAAFLIDGEETSSIYDQSRRAYRLITGTLSPGHHIVTASVFDMAGNTAQQVVQVVFPQNKGVRINITNVPGHVLDQSTTTGTSLSSTPATGFATAPEQSSAQSVFPQTEWHLESPGENAARGFVDLLDDWKRNDKWPKGVFDFRLPGMTLAEPPHVECGELDTQAPVSALIQSTPESGQVFAVDGDVVAEIELDGGSVVEDSISVRIDGVPVSHAYDKKTKKITAHARGLKRGKHTVEVTASDTLGNEGAATAAFGVDPIIYSISIDNADRPGSGHIAGGERFKATVTMDTPDFTGAWIILYNPDNLSPGQGDHMIGRQYYIAATEPGSSTYETISYFYTSRDQSGTDASRVQAAIPLDDPPTQYMFSPEILTIDNPPVRPVFQNVLLENNTSLGSKSINLNDTYSVKAGGSPGVQTAFDMLLNVDTLARGVSNPADAAVRSDTIVEDPYGSGHYVTTGGVAVLDNITDTQGSPARVLLPLVCAPEAGPEVCAYGNALYVGPDPAPDFHSVALQNMSAPGQPFTQPGQEFQISAHVNTMPAVHAPHFVAVLVNADRLDENLVFHETNPFMGPGYLVLHEIQPGVYGATGTLDGFTDGDGQPAMRVAAVVTTAAFFEYSTSNSIDIAQQPQGDIFSVSIRNTSYPDRTTIDIGEGYEITAEAEPGMTLRCKAERLRFGGDGDQSNTPAPMAEGPAGHYVCSGTITSRLDVNGLPADIVIGKAVRPDDGAMETDDFLTLRAGIIEAHIRNTTRSGAIDLAPGETFSIIATATPGLGSIGGGLLDARIIHSPLSGGPFVQSTDPLTENPPGSGQYSVESIFLGAPEGVTAVRGFAGNPVSDDPLTLVLTTESLNILAAPPVQPTVITGIDGVPVTDSEVTSDALEPAITGTAPASSTVNIYELVPGGGIGALEPVPGGIPLSSTFATGVGTYGDSFDNGDYEDNWRVGYNQGVWSLLEQNGKLELDLNSGATVAIDGQQGFSYSDNFDVALDVTFPASQNPPGQDITMRFAISTDLSKSSGEYRRYTLDWRLGDNPAGGTTITLREDGGPECRADYAALALDTTYRLEMDYEASGAPRMDVRVNGAPVLSCGAVSITDGSLRTYIVGENYNSPQPVHIEMDNFDTGVPVPDGYDISGPALQYNGTAYDFLGAGNGLMLDPCGDSPAFLPVNNFSCINGAKDIVAFLVTLWDFNPEPSQPDVFDEAGFTIYTAGNPDIASPDQQETVIRFLEFLKQEGIAGSYSIDAYGTALSARAQGDNHDPVAPISGQLLMCREQVQPGYLRWDGAQQKYLASYTPLTYNNVEYEDYVIWGVAQYDDSPNMITGPDAPIWWADGGDDVYGVLIHADMEGWNATGYATAGFLSNLPQGVTVPAYAVAFSKPADPSHATPDPGDDDYVWNQSALDTAGMSIAPTPVCSGYGRNLIAQTAADGTGGFATRTISLETYGDHLVYAESLDPATSRVLSTSEIVTYHLQQATATTDTTPPAISFTSHSSGDLIADNQPTVTVSITDSGAGVDWPGGVSCETAPTAAPCAVTHSGGNGGTIAFSSPLPDGFNTITVTASDLAAPPNTASASITLEIDSTPPSIDGISVSNSPFSPDNATSIGTKDTTTISASISDAHPDGWYLYIKNQNDDTVRYTTGESTDVSLVWHGADDGGAPQPDGLYTILVGAVDSLGHGTEATAAAIIDNTNPAVEILNPTDSAWLGSATYTVRVQAGDANGIEKVGILLDGAHQGAAAHVDNGVYEFTLDFSGMNNSDHSITARAYDNAGNNAQATATVHIFNKPITIESVTFENITRPGETDIGVGESYRVEIRVSKAQGVPAWRLVNSGRWPAETGPGVDVAFNITSSNQQGKRYTYDAVLAACADADGNPAPGLRIAASADGFNNVELSGILAIPSCAPAAPEPPVITKPQNGATVKDSTPEVRGTAQAGVKVYIYLGDPGDAQPDDLIAIVDAVPANGRFSTETLDLGVAGQKTIYAIAEKDVLGAILQSAPSAPVTFTHKDTERPVVSGQDAAPDPFSPGVSIGFKDTTTITANALDETLASWQIKVFTTDASGAQDKLLLKHEEPFVNPNPAGPNPISYVWDGYSRKPKDTDTRFQLQPEGVYLYEIIATDTNGKKSESATGTLRIHTGAPAATIISPANGSILGGIQQPILINATDTLGIDTVEIYVDNTLHSTAWSTGVNEWTGIFALKLIGDGSHSVGAVAVDIAGNRSATSSINIIIDTVAPSPPENLTAVDNGDGTVTLMWEPPTTNEDGSPLTDLVGYNIYVATETNRCDPLLAADGASITCASGGAPGSYTINGPALVFNNVTYNRNPFGGNTALWLDTAAAANGAPPVETLHQLPLNDSVLVQPGKPVFAYTLTLSMTAGNDGVSPGGYTVTVYTQAGENELSEWLNISAQNGYLIESQTVIAAHAPACQPSSFSSALTPESCPLNAIPHFNFQKINSSLTVEPVFTYDIDDLLGTTVFAVDAIDIMANSSNFTIFAYARY